MVQKNHQKKQWLGVALCKSEPKTTAKRGLRNGTVIAFSTCVGGAHFCHQTRSSDGFTKAPVGVK